MLQKILLTCMACSAFHSTIYTAARGRAISKSESMPIMPPRTQPPGGLPLSRPASPLVVGELPSLPLSIEERAPTYNPSSALVRRRVIGWNEKTLTIDGQDPLTIHFKHTPSKQGSLYSNLYTLHTGHFNKYVIRHHDRLKVYRYQYLWRFLGYTGMTASLALAIHLLKENKKINSTVAVSAGALMFGILMQKIITMIANSRAQNREYMTKRLASQQEKIIIATLLKKHLENFDVRVEEDYQVGAIEGETQEREHKAMAGNRAS